MTEPVTAANYRINELARFRILVGGIGATCCMSTFYGFNILSNYMMEEYNFTANDLTAITTTGIVVGFVTLPFGMLLDYAGPMWVCICACTLNALGALLFALAFHKVIAASVIKFAVFCAIMNLGCASFDTGSLMAVMGSFPLTKGFCVAIMKTFAGLGASCLAMIRYSFFNKYYSGYMFFMTGLVVVAGGTAITFIRFPPYHLVDWEKKHVDQETQIRRRLTERAYMKQYPPVRRFLLGCSVIIALVIYVTTNSICVAYVDDLTDASRLGLTIGMIILVLCLTLVAAPFPFLGGMDQPYSPHFPEAVGTGLPSADPHEYDDEEQRKVLQATEAELVQDNNALDELYVAEPVAADDLGKGVAIGDGDGPSVTVANLLEDDTVFLDEANLDPQYQGTFWQNLRTVDLWLCFWNTFCTWGCGMVIAFNSAQQYRALHNGQYSEKVNAMYAALIGIGSALGRMSMGIFEVLLVRSSPEKRPVITIVYPVASICMVLGLVFLLAIPEGSNASVVGFFFDSLGNGFSWACTALVIRTLYAKDIGKHYNLMYCGAFLAVIALNRFAYGEQFTQEAKRQDVAAKAAGKPSIYPHCAGKKCVRNAFIILLCINATAIIASGICHYRYRRFVMNHRAERAARAAAGHRTEDVDADSGDYAQE